MSDLPQIWVLADDRAGNVAQGLGVAEALGEKFAIKTLIYDRWAALPNSLRGAGLLGVSKDSRAGLAPPWPRLVIAAGRRTAPVARWIKRRSGAFLCQIMDPFAARDDFDLIVLPHHDGTISHGENVLRVTGAPHRIRPEILAAEATAWRDRFAALPRPWVAVSVGGATKNRAFTAEMARTLIADSSALAEAQGGSLLVSTSRRTGAKAEAAIAQALPPHAFLYRWSDGGDNPYRGFLALADALVVTGDSVSMCSEACASPAPVFIFAPPGMVTAKHARLHGELVEKGYASLLGAGLPGKAHPPLNAADQVAAVLRQRVRGLWDE